MNQEVSRMRAWSKRQMSALRVRTRKTLSVRNNLTDPGGSRQTSSWVSTIASNIMKMSDEEMKQAFNNDHTQFAKYIRSVAASALSQDETKGQDQ